MCEKAHNFLLIETWLIVVKTIFTVQSPLTYFKVRDEGDLEPRRFFQGSWRVRLLHDAKLK